MPIPPHTIFGLNVICVCDECGGDGVLWGYDGETFWADKRCARCNCVGLILDLPEFWKKREETPKTDEMDQGDEVPF